METSDTSISLGKLAPAKALPDDVYDALLQLLTWGNLPADSQLSIDRLAQSLGVSPTPVREALARLESTGLVRREARRGYRVSPPMSASQMVELVDARLVLECAAMQRAMGNPEVLVGVLESAFAAHARAADELARARFHDQPEALRRYFEQDWSFHEAILSNCGNRYLELAVNAMSFRVHRMRQTVGAGHSDAPLAVEEHRRILEAVKSRDEERAVEALSQHLSCVMKRVAEPTDEVPL